MANTISYAKQYINNQQEVMRMFNTELLCRDLLKPLREWKGKTVSYDRLSFASYTMGTYNRATGCPSKDLTFERVDKTLSQDRGDSLSLDVADKNEAQIADGIIGVYNFYNVKVAVPTIDTYAFKQLSKAGSGAKFNVHSSLTKDNIVAALFADFKTLKNKRVKTAECIVYIGSTAMALLEEATYGKGILTIGNWNGDLETTATMIKGAKIVEVPDDELESDVQWIICHPLAADVIPVLNAAEFKDYIPGFVGKAQVDVRFYFDAWIQPNGGDGIVVSLSAARAGGSSN